MIASAIWACALVLGSATGAQAPCCSATGAQAPLRVCLWFGDRCASTLLSTFGDRCAGTFALLPLVRRPARRHLVVRRPVRRHLCALVPGSAAVAQAPCCSAPGAQAPGAFALLSLVRRPVRRHLAVRRPVRRHLCDPLLGSATGAQAPRSSLRGRRCGLCQFMYHVAGWPTNT